MIACKETVGTGDVGRSVRPFTFTDLFCGAGGSVTGTVEAAEGLGRTVKFKAFNHNPVAISTLRANHPEADARCAAIDDINPSTQYKEGELDLLTASPECTHHSVARGGKPINDQSRATAFCVARWAAALLPKIILVENVPEFQTWGPLIQKRRKAKIKVRSLSYRQWRRKQRSASGRLSRSIKRQARLDLSRKAWKRASPLIPKQVTRMEWVPDPKKKGVMFRAWVQMLEAIGYRVEWRVICCADFGDPTTRQRLFVQAVRGKLKIVWPDSTHAETPESESLFAHVGVRRLPWNTARNSVVNWAVPGRSIFERKVPLVVNTTRRILAGFERFGTIPFVIPAPSGGKPRTVHLPIHTLTTEGRGNALIQSFIVEHRGTSAEQIVKGASSLDHPLSTVATSGAHHGLACSFLVHSAHTGDRPAHSADAPTPTACGNRGDLSVVCSFAASAPRADFLVSSAHGNDPGDETNGDRRRTRSMDSPLPTVTGSKDWGQASAFILPHARNEERPRSADEPLNTITATSADIRLIGAALIPNFGERDTQEPRAHDVDCPAPTVTGHGVGALSTAFLLGQQSGAAARSANEPLPTVSTAGAIGMVESGYLITIDHQGGNGACVYSLDAPLTTHTTKQRHLLCQPFLVNYYGTGVATSVEKPMPSATTRERHALVRPSLQLVKTVGDSAEPESEGPTFRRVSYAALKRLWLRQARARRKLTRAFVQIGDRVLMLEITHRMLDVPELAAAQGFRSDYRFLGTKTEQVKQIGNAVPRRTFRALVTAALTQKSDVSQLSLLS